MDFDFISSLILIQRPCIGFLSVGPDVCRRLPSDSVSRRTPLPLAVTFPLSGRFGDFHPLEYVRAGRTKKRLLVNLTRSPRRTAAAYSPTWWGSTIGDGGLNFSVRNGKRWFPAAIATAICYLRETTRLTMVEIFFQFFWLIFLSGKISGY